MSDPHRCLSGPSCRDAKELDGARVGTLTEHQNTICEPCRTHITNACSQLLKDWRELRKALGDKTSGITEIVRSTPTPAVPISMTKDALMTQIVEMVDRAAAVVSDALSSDQPDSRHGRRRYCGRFAPHEEPSLQASLAIVEPHVDKLAAAESEPHVMWAPDGEQRELTEMAGIDIAWALVDVHNKTRAELGKTRLRHRYELPCPRCGGEVGRDDGTTIVDCKNEACKASWTEREFKFLQGLIVEGQEKEIMKWLLGEAYSRLDSIDALVAKLTADERINVPGSAVTMLLEELTKHLTGHTAARDREIATDKAAASARQVEEDNWSWRNEKPYRPPKRKKTKPKPEPKERYAASSLALDAPIYLPEPGETRSRKCVDCNEIHAGQCIGGAAPKPAAEEVTA